MWILLLWFTLIGTDTYAAGASASASASVISPGGVNSAVTTAVSSYWDTIFSSDASIGSVSIRIAGTALYASASSAADAVKFAIIPSNVRFARLSLVDRLKSVSETGMLGGTTAVDLMVDDDLAVSGPVSVTVTYN